MASFTPVSFPPFHLDRSGQLRCGEEERFLRPKTLAVLHYLVHHAGQVVSKDELFTAVWPEVIVSEAVLAVCINELRQALEDDPRQPRFIATVHRRGYRFLPTVTTRPVVSGQLSVVSSDKAELKPQVLTTDHWPLTTPFVGREAELAQLQQWWELARRGQRQVVFIAGEPGIGKTTLIDRFVARLSHEHEFWIGRGQCVEQYGEGEAYLPILEALGQLCRGPEGRQVREVLHRHAPTWLLQMPGLVETAELSALQVRTAGATRERMLREMAEALEALTVARGLVLVCEDVHVSDRSTLDLIAYLARRRGPARLLILGTYRPAEVIVRTHPLKGIVQELQGRQQCQQLVLDLLSARAVSEYLTVRFAPQPVPLAFTAQVYDRTEGNALFVVTLVDYLLQRGLLRQENGEWRWPDSLQGIGVSEGVRQLIEQQIEHLSEEEQRVLEVASVAGMEFSAAVVSAGLEIELLRGEERCEAMARRTLFLQATGIEEWPDGTEATQYRFRHAVYQEVVYDRLTASRQRALHQRLGERLEAAYGQQAGEIAAILAMHFKRGRDYQRAVQYCQRAATNAMQRSAYSEALSHLTTGLALLASLPESPERWQQEFFIQIALGLVLQATKGSAATERETAYARAYALAQLHGDPLQQSLALQGLWNFSWMQGALQTARMQGEQLLVLAQQSQTPWLFFGAHRALGGAFYFLGELPLARTHLEQALSRVDLHQGYPDEFYHGQAFVEFVPAYLAFTLWLLGYADQARQRMSEAQTLAQQAGDCYGITAVSAWAMHLQYLLQERQAVRTHSEQLIELATTQGFPQWVALGKLFEGWILTGQGQGEQGILQIRQGLAAFQASGARLALPHFFSLLIDAHRMRRQWGEGLGVVADAFAVVEQTGERFYEAELWRLKGELTLQKGTRDWGLGAGEEEKQKAKSKARQEVRGLRLETGASSSQAPSLKPLVPSGVEEEVEGYFRKAIDIARQQQAKSLELRAVMSLARLWQQQGKKEEARQMLAGIYHWFTEGFDTKDLQEARALLDDLRQ